MNVERMNSDPDPLWRLAMTRRPTSLTLSTLIVLVSFLVCTSPSLADIPQLINYQGKVTDTGGTPVPDGSYDMRFNIYDVETGGTDLWYSGNVSVQVTGGIFNVLLGESPMPAINLPFDVDYWLNVWIAGDTQTPRQRLGSMGYAYMASGLVPGTQVSGSVTSSPYSVITGANTATAGTAYGIYGSSASTSARGVFGIATIGSGNTYGVFGQSNSTSGRGIYGLANATTGTNYGVYGRSQSPSGYAGYFQGNARVTGDLTVDGALTAPGIGDITAVTAGTGLDGGGTSGAVTLNVEVPLSLTASVVNPPYAIVKGTNTATTDDVAGLIGESACPGGGGVYGHGSATTGETYGVFGLSASTDGMGVYGWATATATAGEPYGGKFVSDSPYGSGVYGYNSSTSWYTEGVYGESASDNGIGVFGIASATSGLNYGVSGGSHSPDGRAVYGWAYSSTGTNYAVYGETSSASGFGGYFEDDVHIEGTLSKGSGSFVIDHPLDPENRLLRHNFVESPENLLIYRGTVELGALGEAVVQLPEYFRALTGETGASVQLTPLGKPFLTGYEWGSDHTSFTVYGDAVREVSWMVMADRDDPVIHQLARPVEEDKGPDNKYCDKGRLIYPEAFGYPETKGRNYEYHEQLRRPMEENEARRRDSAAGK